MQVWRGHETAGLWGRIWPSEGFPAVAMGTPRRLQQGATPGHQANCFNPIQQFLSKYCVSVAYACVSPPKVLTAVPWYGCVDAEDVAAAVSGMDAVMGCWFSSDMMDAAHYAADRTLLVQHTTLLTYHPDVWLYLKLKTSKRSLSADITLDRVGERFIPERRTII